MLHRNPWTGSARAGGAPASAPIPTNLPAGYKLLSVRGPRRSGRRGRRSRGDDDDDLDEGDDGLKRVCFQPPAHLSRRDCGELCAMVTLFFMAAVALIALHIGSKVSMCERPSGGDGDDASLRRMRPCMSSYAGASLLAANPHLASLDNLQYAASLASSARSHPRYGTPAVPTSDPSMRGGSAFARARYYGHGHVSRERHWFDMLNTSTFMCPDARPVGSSKVGERKFICGAALWSKGQGQGQGQEKGVSGAAGAGTQGAAQEEPGWETDSASQPVPVVPADPQLHSSCVILSVGGNLEWDFEDAVLALTPACVVYTLDCTVDPERFMHPMHSPRIRPIHLCMDGKDHVQGSTMKKSLPDGQIVPAWEQRYMTVEGVLRTLARESAGKRGAGAGEGKGKGAEPAPFMADLWKVDCEGCEFAVATSLLRIAQLQSEGGAGGVGGGAGDPGFSSSVLPSQMAIEVHASSREECTYTDTLWFFTTLAKAGYVVVHREDNPTNDFVTEFTLVRAYC
jgi:hypothetical protein